MELNYFKDQLFDLINECEQYDILNIISQEHEHRLLSL